MCYEVVCFDATSLNIQLKTLPNPTINAFVSLLMLLPAAPMLDATEESQGTKVLRDKQPSNSTR